MLKDTVTRKYMADNLVFADVFNYYLFDGEQIIQPDSLVDCNSEKLALPEDAKGHIVPLKRVRDLLKKGIMKTDGEQVFLLLGLEDQSEVHYAMPVKNLLYDAMDYAEQVEQIGKRHSEKHDSLTPAEFLSGFTSGDKLIPVITLVIYFGADAWDAPRSLHEMLAVKDRRILRYVDDYHVHLVVPSEIRDFSGFSTELGMVLEFLKESTSRERIEMLLERRKKEFSNVDRDTVRVINACANTKIGLGRKGRTVNMCKAFEEQRELGVKEGRKEGRIEGKIEGRLEGRIEGKLIAFMELAEKGLLTKKQAAEQAGLSEEDFSKKCAQLGMVLQEM